MEDKPHQHVWAYRGLEYEIGERIKGIERVGNFRVRVYHDVFFCQHCLEEQLVPRYLANDTSQVPVPGSTPRGRQPGEIVEAPKEEEPPAPIEHTEPGKLGVHETYGWFLKQG